MSSCGTRRHVFLWHEKASLLVPREDMSSCGKKARPLVAQGHMLSCTARRQVFLWHRKTCRLREKSVKIIMQACLLRRKKTCLLVAREVKSSCATRTQVSLLNRKPRLHLELENMSLEEVHGKNGSGEDGQDIGPREIQSWRLQACRTTWDQEAFYHPRGLPVGMAMVAFRLLIVRMVFLLRVVF